MFNVIIPAHNEADFIGATLEGLLARAKTEERREELRAELAATVLPAAGAYLWTAYSRLRRRKGGDGLRNRDGLLVEMLSLLISTEN